MKEQDVQRVESKATQLKRGPGPILMKLRVLVFFSDQIINIVLIVLLIGCTILVLGARTQLPACLQFL